MVASRMYLDKAEYGSFDIKNPTIPNKREEYLDYVNEMKEAKLKHKQGTLCDVWINTLIETIKDPEKYEELQTRISSDSLDESIKLLKEIVSELVASKLFQS